MINRVSIVMVALCMIHHVVFSYLGDAHRNVRRFALNAEKEVISNLGPPI